MRPLSFVGLWFLLALECVLGGILLLLHQRFNFIRIFRHAAGE